MIVYDFIPTPPHNKKDLWEYIKNIFKYGLLILLTLFNLILLYPLSFTSFAVFSWITLFILSCIWVYLFFYWTTYMFFQALNINRKINKLILFSIYPVVMLPWFGFSFVPLEWQPSFREFERLCREEGDKTTIYNQEIYDRIMKGTTKSIEIWEDKKMSWRIKEAVLNVYERNTNILVKSYKTFAWYDRGMIPKNERTITCASIDKTKELIKKRLWLK